MDTKEELLMENETGFKTLFDNANIGIIIVNEEGRIKLSNQYSAKIFGYNKEELPGKPLEVLIPNTYRKRHKNLYREYFNHPNPELVGNALSLFALKKNGIEFPVEISLAHYESNCEVLAIAFVKDVTEKKNAIGALKVNEEKYRNLYNNSVVAMHTSDLQTFKVTEANDVSVGMFGYKSKQDFLDNFNTVSHFVNRQDRDRNIKSLRDEGEVRNSIHRIKRLNGEFLWVKVFAKINSNKTEVNTVIIDITEQVNAHLKVTESEEKYRNMFENSVVSMFTADLKTHKTVKVNGVCVSMFGYKSSEEFLKLFHSSKHFVNENERENVIEMLMQKNELETVSEMKKLDGTHFWANIFAKINHDRTEMQAVLIDVTDSKRTHEELEGLVEERTLELTSTLEREKELNELKSRFVSTASHEFRTPLSAILSSVSILEMYNKEEQAEKRKKHLDRIKSSVDNLVDILNDFLSLDKLEQGKFEIAEERFNLREFAIDIIEEIQGMLKRGQNIDFVFKGKKEITKDKKILRNVLLNLLSNAIKYSGENKMIELNIEVNKKGVIIKVKDNGIGIPADEQKNLFEKFYRATNAVNIQGTGLGLNIVKKYVELLGGIINFVSKPNHGTTFKIEFPTDN